MTLQDLADRTTAAQIKMAAKQKTLAAKTAKLASGKGVDQWNRDTLEDDCKRLVRDISEIEEIIAKYQIATAAVQKEEQILISLPTAFWELHDHIIAVWDKFDAARRDNSKAAYKEQVACFSGFGQRKERQAAERVWFQTYSRADYDNFYKTNADFNRENVKAARDLLLDIYTRLHEITGDFTDAGGLTVDRDNQGYSIINGCIKGEKATATVNSIYAGGYNIQKLHIRVLVHKL